VRLHPPPYAPLVPDESRLHPQFVMAELIPAIHVFVRHGIQDVDARGKRGHDDSIKFHSVMAA
jgi:hypothetical protein